MYEILLLLPMGLTFFRNSQIGMLSLEELSLSHQALFMSIRHTLNVAATAVYSPALVGQKYGTS
jgi:hypothetical protein